MHKGLSATATCLLWSFLSASAVLAFPIAPPGTECLPVIVSSTGNIIARYEGNSASFSNDLYLMLDATGNPGDDGNPSNDRFIFNNHTSPVLSEVDLGSFAPGTELIFRLHVQNTGNDWQTGPASRNGGQCRARVLNSWTPNRSLVSFEDYVDFQFNDLSFSFTNTSTNKAPEPQGFPVGNVVNFCNVDQRGISLSTSFTSPEPDQTTTTVVTTNLPPGRYTVTSVAGNPSTQLLQFTPARSDLDRSFTVTYVATDNGSPPQTTTVAVVINVSQADCPTRAKRSSWGALKTLYR